MSQSIHKLITSNSTDNSIKFLENTKVGVKSILSQTLSKNTVIDIDEIKTLQSNIKYPEVFEDLLTKQDFIKTFQLMNPENIHHTFLENVVLITKTYFPGVKIRTYENIATFRLNSYHFRKFLLMVNFLEKAEGWRKYLRDNQNNFYINSNKGRKIFNDYCDAGRTTTSDSSIYVSPFIKMTKDGTFVFSIPTYKHSVLNNVDSEFIRLLYKDLNDLITFSYYVNYIADLYTPIGNIIEKENEKYASLQETQKNESLPKMIDFLKSRIIKKSDIKDRKNITKALLKNFKELNNIFIPLSNELPLVDSYSKLELQVCVYMNGNKTNEKLLNHDYVILPPLSSDTVVKGYHNTGIFNLTGFNNIKNQKETDYAPHVIEEKHSVALNEFVFVDAILMNEEYSEFHEVLHNTMVGLKETAKDLVIENNPGTFDILNKKNEKHFEELVDSEILNLIMYLNRYLNIEEEVSNIVESEGIFASLEKIRKDLQKELNYANPSQPKMAEPTSYELPDADDRARFSLNTNKDLDYTPALFRIKYYVNWKTAFVLNTVDNTYFTVPIEVDNKDLIAKKVSIEAFNRYVNIPSDRRFELGIYNEAGILSSTSIEIKK